MSGLAWFDSIIGWTNYVQLAFFNEAPWLWRSNLPAEGKSWTFAINFPWWLAFLPQAVGTPSAVLLTGSSNWGPLQPQRLISGLQLFPYLKLTLQKREQFERRWEPRFSTSCPNILVTSQGHLTLRLMTCNEWKRTQRQNILLFICIFQLSDLQEQIFGLSLRQRLHCVTYFPWFFVSLKGT